MTEEVLRRRKLGRTDMVVTELSLGGGGIGGLRSADDDESAAATVIRAWQRGINYIDTAPGYAESERRIGLALRRMGGRPEGLYISTKTRVHLLPNGEHSASETRASVENSLRVLGVDSVDLLLVHEPESMEPVLAPGGVLDEMERTRDEGKFRWIGLGCRAHHKHYEAIRSGRFDAIMTFADYNLVRQTATPLVEEAAASGVGVILAQVFLFGLLAGPEPTGEPYDGTWRARTKYLLPDVQPAHDWWVWARERGISLRALALQYGLRNPHVHTVCVGASSPKQVEENLAAMAEPIPEGIWAEVEEYIARQGGD